MNILHVIVTFRNIYSFYSGLVYKINIIYISIWSGKCPFLIVMVIFGDLDSCVGLHFTGGAEEARDQSYPLTIGMEEAI